MLNWKNLNGKKYLHFVPDEECTCIYVNVPIRAILYEGYKTCLISSGDFIILKPIGQKSFSLKSEYSGVLTYMAKEWGCMECYFLILNLIYCILIRLNLVLWSIKNGLMSWKTGEQ